MRPKQQTLAASGFERYRKRTRREQFLADMSQVVPWGALVGLIAPVYPKGEGAGRPPVGLERMLRIHCLQHWFNLSDPAAEEALYDSRAMREFVGIDLGREPVPVSTGIQISPVSGSENSSPGQLMASGSSARTRPALSLSLSR
jgi:IS5 family transposase